MSIGLASNPLAAQRQIGVFDAQADVGQVTHKGTATYDPVRQEYLVAGSGRNMWGAQDDFHYVWKRVSGNFILSTEFICIAKMAVMQRMSK